ncbi:hypothetical protein BV898_06866 [Hypsibius exemplaris]|uniref:Uncharacterized protein n=1 Tax=Hypsibius exemplaris TaxID=2072580 RepID=A0A1W0WUW7_HYPEX|nr:hypothetical protein BV898_06866 [Hypsibius exemplaris]
MMYLAGPNELASQTTTSLQQQGAGLHLAMEYLQEHYGRLFSFTHTSLPSASETATQFSLEYDAEDLVAGFFFRDVGGRDKNLALICPCIILTETATKRIP